MIARIVLLVSLVLLVAAPAGGAEAVADPLVLVESGPAPLAVDDEGAFVQLAGWPAAATAPHTGATGACFADEAVPPGPPLARVFRPPRPSIG